jgi:beta-xylosidase
MSVPSGGPARRNPVLPGLFADPDLVQGDDGYYLYPTTDGFPGWSGTNFRVFSSPDLERWTDRGVVLDLAAGDVAWARGHAWAPAAVRRGGRWYLYFCAKRPDGVSCIGAAVAPGPTGPFVAAAEPLVTPEAAAAAGIRLDQAIDPSVFVDDDGAAYLLFGNGAAAVARLDADMVGFAPAGLRRIEGLCDFREAVSVLKRGGLYHFTWSCDDTGSPGYHVNYGVSASLRGPVEFRRAVLQADPERGILGTGHHSILKLDGRDEYRIAYHRFATPVDAYPDGKGWHREVCIDVLEFGPDGLMRPVACGL